jgi:L-fucose isomerase-like protein
MTIENKALMPRVGVGSLCSPLEVGADRAPQAAIELCRILKDAGCEVVELGPVDRPDKSVAAGRKLAESHVHAVALVATSWFEDYLAFDLSEECRVPLLLWSLPGMETGALCGVQQLTVCLKQLGVPYLAIYGAFDSPDGLKHGKTFVRAMALSYRLRRARIGLAGYRIGGMMEVAVNELALKKCFGPRIVPLDLPRLLAAAKELPDQQVLESWRGVIGRAGCCKVSDTDGLDSMKIYVVMQQLVEQYGLDALAVGCFPHLMGRVCLAASLLADQGIPLACEGDVGGALGQLMLTLLTDGPTHNTDWLDPLDENTNVFTHCGSGSFSLAENPADIQLNSVRLMGQGVCALFPAKPGPVTMLNILPIETGYQIAVLEGHAISTSMVFPGNPLRVTFGRPIAELIDWIYDEGIGHHWMAAYGHVGAEVHQWCKTCPSDLKVVALEGVHESIR